MSELTCLSHAHSDILLCLMPFWVFAGSPCCYFRSRHFLSGLCISVNASVFLSGLSFTFFSWWLLWIWWHFTNENILLGKQRVWANTLLFSFCLLCLLEHKDIFRMGILCQCRFVWYTLEWEVKNDWYLVLMHSIRKAFMVVITITTATRNYSLNPGAIIFSFSLDLHL